MSIVDDEFLTSLTCGPIVQVTSGAHEKAFTRIVHLVASRERCVFELRARLLRDGFSEEETALAIERAASCGLVDDVRYASILIRSRIAQGRGRAGIEDELKRLGILVCDLPDWPEAYFGDDERSEEDRAFELLQRKPPRSKNAYAAACRRLAAQGYDAETVFSVARRYTKHAGLF